MVGAGDVVEVTVLRMVRILPVSDNVTVAVSMAVTVTAATVLSSDDPVLRGLSFVSTALPFAFARRQMVGSGFAAMLPLKKTTRTAAYLKELAGNCRQKKRFTHAAVATKTSCLLPPVAPAIIAAKSTVNMPASPNLALIFSTKYNPTIPPTRKNTAQSALRKVATCVTCFSFENFEKTRVKRSESGDGATEQRSAKLNGL
jgi:hypothetical protein